MEAAFSAWETWKWIYSMQKQFLKEFEGQAFAAKPVFFLPWKCHQTTGACIDIIHAICKYCYQILPSRLINSGSEFSCGISPKIIKLDFVITHIDLGLFNVYKDIYFKIYIAPPHFHLDMFKHTHLAIAIDYSFYASYLSKIYFEASRCDCYYFKDLQRSNPSHQWITGIQGCWYKRLDSEIAIQRQSIDNTGPYVQTELPE